MGCFLLYMVTNTLRLNLCSSQGTIALQLFILALYAKINVGNHAPVPDIFFYNFSGITAIFRAPNKSIKGLKLTNART